MGAWQSPQQQELEKKPVVTGDPSSRSQVRFQLREKGHLDNWSQNGKPGVLKPQQPELVSGHQTLWSSTLVC